MAQVAAPVIAIGPAVPPPDRPALLSEVVAYGQVAVRLGRGTRQVQILDGRVQLARARVSEGPRRLSLAVAPGRHEIRVRAVGLGGSRLGATRTVWVLPTSARRVGRIGGFVDTGLQRDLERLATGAPAITGIYVQHLLTGCGAAINAGAQFPAASTLKSGILVHAVRRGGVPASLLDAMVLDSSDLAANDVIGRVGGAAAITRTLADLGLRQALVRRPYIIDRQSNARRSGRGRRRIEVQTTAQPALFTNFIITPAELATLMAAIHRGALGAGGVGRLGISRRAARDEILVRLLNVKDRSKLVAGLPSGVPVAHKSGYTTQTKHDGGIVYLRSGPVAVAVMSWSASGVSDGWGDGFIARVATASRAHLVAGGRCGQ